MIFNYYMAVNSAAVLGISCIEFYIIVVMEMHHRPCF